MSMSGSIKGEPEDNEKIEFLKHATTAACERVLDEMGSFEMTIAEWKSLRAPSNAATPADDARKTCPLLDGWTKLTVPFSEYNNIEGGDTFTNTIHGWKTYPIPTLPGSLVRHDDVPLPDQWIPDRDHHHAWYAKHVDLGETGGDNTWIHFDAVAHACAVFVNGKEAGRHLGGYTPFEFDLTPFLRPGRNAIAIWVQDDTAVFFPESRRAIAQLDGGRGVHNSHLAGIRGGVHLERRRPVHVARNRIKTSTRNGVLSVETWVRGDTEGATISHAVHEWPNGVEVEPRVQERPIEGTKSDGLLKVEASVSWSDAKWWSPERPNLHVLRTTITTDHGSETIETRFGFREFWIEGKNFMLNGNPIRLFGDGDHRKELLSMVPEKTLEYDVNTLRFLKKEFNFMALRLHGSLHPRWALLAADEVGCLVINQTGLRYNRKNHYENGEEEFLHNVEKEFDEWYWRDVNSPSCVIWDVENELIRGQRAPQAERWVLRLDDFIKKHDPEAIVEHSGAAWYKPDQEVIHVHMQEQYNRIMRTWEASAAVPLNLGEFWMGGRGETRLPNAYEYSTRLDWHQEEARIYREQMLEMRYFGASGMMPHRLTHWPLIRPGALWSRDDCETKPADPYSWRFGEPLTEGARGLAPIVGFLWPRHATVFQDEPFEREVVVCNDTESTRSLTVKCEYGCQGETWTVELAPGEQTRLPVTLTTDDETSNAVVSVTDENGAVVEGDAVTIHPVSRSLAETPTLQRRIVVVPDIDDETAEGLNELNVPHEVSETLPVDAENTIVIVPPGVSEDALGRTPTRVREYVAAGGRLLVLEQHRETRWIPLDFPFASATRTSIPEFDRGGWEPTNKDLIYSRDVPVYGRGHPAFQGLEPVDFKEWDPVDGRISDDVYLRPNAVKTQVGGEYRPLLGATRRENATLVEFRIGPGSGVLCQAQLLRLRVNPAARVLFMNLLRHLDGPAWASSADTVGLLGNLSASKMAELTSVEESSFVQLDDADAGAEARFILAGDGVDPARIERLAEQGAVILVLSRETCERLPGFDVERDDEGYYSATRKGVEDHPLFWGVAGASFLPLEDTPVQGALSKIPDDARVLLGGHCRGNSPFANDWSMDIGFYGLEAREPAPPIAAGRRVGDGEIIATTIEPWNAKSETQRQLLVNLLANAGVAIPRAVGQASTIEVKRTIPLEFDGRLDDWTNDMEDITFGEHCHAVPIPVSSKDAVKGEVADDFDLSAVVYLLHDDDNLHVGGIVFSPKTPPVLKLKIDERTVSVDLAGRAVTIDDGKPLATPNAFGEQTAAEVIDCRLLHLTRSHRQTGKSDFVGDTLGTTFETMVPWRILGFDDAPSRAQAALTLVRDQVELRHPVPAEGEPDAFLLQFQPPSA